MTGESALTYVLDENGEPRPAEPGEWGPWFENAIRQVAFNKCESGNVSTVFMGIRSAVSGPPDLWETTIFGGAHNGYRVRHTSKQAALDGHAHAVRIANGEIPRE